MRTRSVVHAENGLVDLDGVTHLPTASPAPLAATGLIMVIWPKLYLRTGIAMGPVAVELEPLDAAPSDGPRVTTGGPWEDIVEFTAEHAPGTSVAVHGASELSPEGASAPTPTTSHQGSCGSVSQQPAGQLPPILW
jgi:hypothetical protein